MSKLQVPMSKEWSLDLVGFHDSDPKVGSQQCFEAGSGSFFNMEEQNHERLNQQAKDRE